MLFEHRYKNVIEFLLNKGNVVVQYRVLTELFDNADIYDINMAWKKVVEFERVSRLIECLKKRKEYHGATNLAAENALNMLVDMGVKYNNGVEEFDRVVELMADEIQQIHVEKNHVLCDLQKIVMVPFLLRAGLQQEWIREFIIERICVIHEFVKQKRYDIYDDVGKYKGIPKGLASRLVIDPSLYENGKIRFPLEYDIYGFAAIISQLTGSLQSKVNDIVSYILDYRFQSIEDGYGLLYNKNRFYSMGWDPKPTSLHNEKMNSSILLKLDLLAHFPCAINSKWFIDAFELLDEYRNNGGIYCFPKGFLTEKESCWILGNHMSLGENRRSKDALLVEGTFRTYKIIKHIEDLKNN